MPCLAETLFQEDVVENIEDVKLNPVITSTEICVEFKIQDIDCLVKSVVNHEHLKDKVEQECHRSSKA